MNFSGRLKTSSYLSLGLILIMLPVLVWSLARTDAAKNDDYLADEIQVRVYERIVYRDEYILYQEERSKVQWRAATAATDQLLRKAAVQLTDKAAQPVLAKMRESFDDTVVIFGRILEHTELAKKSGDTRSFHDTDLGRRLYGQLVLRTNVLQEATFRLQKITESRVALTNNRSIIITSLFVVAVALGSAINARFLNLFMRLRLESLHSGARIIAAGDLDYRIENRGSDEFSDLARTINLMTNKVQDYTRALQKSHDLLEGLSRQVPGILFQTYLSSDGHFSTPYASEAIHDIYELPPSAVTEDVKPIFDRVHPDDRDGLIDSIMESSRTLATWAHEYRVVLPRQGIKWCHGIARPQKQEEGSILWYGFVADITDRKRIEGALLESEKRFRRQFEELSQIYKFSPVGLFAVDLELRFFRINERMSAINGKSIEEHLGRTIDEVLPADLAETLRKIWQPVLERGEVVLNVEVQGTVWWSLDVARHWLANYYPYRSESGDISGLMGSVMDITDRKQAETALLLSEERYRAVVEDQTETISRYKADGTYTFVNDVFCRIFGKTGPELLGSTWHPDAFPGDLPVIEEQLSRLSPSHPVVVIENRIYSGSGAVRWMQFVNRGFFDKDGQLIETQVVGRDITDRKNLELRLAGIRDDLERQVQERTQSLTEINERLQAEIHERQQIEKELLDQHRKLESMAIEITLAEERERERIAGELHDQVGQRLILGRMKLGALASQIPADGCKQDIEELDRIIDLSIQDIRSLTFQLRPPLLATAGLEPALHWLGEEFQDRHGLRLTFSDDGQKKPLRYEARSTLFQAAREVLMNTVKHADATRIGISTSLDAGRLLVRIFDNGRGFDVTEAGKKKAKSGGFGLINVQRRIEHLGGSVTIESGHGQGTCVTIMVPLDLSQEVQGGSTCT